MFLWSSFYVVVMTACCASYVGAELLVFRRLAWVVSGYVRCVLIVPDRRVSC